MRDPRRWEIEQSHARCLLGNAHASISDGGLAAQIQGKLSVTSEHGREYGPFEIRIVYPDDFGLHTRTPSTYILSQPGWTRGRDSHIEPDGRLCQFVPGEGALEIDFTSEDSLPQFLANAKVFLFKEWVYQRRLSREQITGEKAVWPGDARAHGVLGVSEAVRAIGGVRPRDPCPCGKGRSYGSCCQSEVEGW